MNNRLLNKLVFQGISKNKKTMIPFFIAETFIVMVYYILTSLAFGPYIYYDHKEVFYGAQTVAILLDMASGIIGIFAVIFIMYANQFVMKDRKREIGLYGILGLSKTNITVMMIKETIIKAVVGIGGGVLVGTFLNKIMLLILFKIVKEDPVKGILFSSVALKKTIILFAFILIACCIYNISSVNLGSPIELLRSNKTGEKEPKVKWVTFVIGIVTLVMGYYMALSCKSTGEAVEKLFTSIFLVIVGTYCLFIAGSIFVLKKLKNNKKYYYRTNNFISVSNLIYRMKHNAAGLASICVLSTGVILLVTCATTLMALGRQNVDTMFPKDVMAVSKCDKDDYEKIYTSLINKATDKADVKVSDCGVYSSYNSCWGILDDGFEFIPENSPANLDTQAIVYVLDEKNYELLSGEKVSLGDNEILFADTKKSDFETVKINDKSYKVAGKTNIKKLNEITQSEMCLFDNVYVVAKDMDSVNALLSGDENTGAPNVCDIIFSFNVDGNLSTEEINTITKEITGYSEDTFVNFKQDTEKLFVTMYGGVFFVGIFLAVLFLLATVLIIYYKQLSEGFEDQEKYKILKKVGLTDKEVKKTIKRQVMILFFLPVVTSIIHMIVASSIVRLFLRIILMVDAVTFNLSIAAVILVFVVVYVLVYKVTSRVYYKIVNAN